MGLHSAAASGDVGLLEYALNRGQPVNSVVDGVLPLHAACSGGNVQVVKLLIDHGADVNAPRYFHSSWSLIILTDPDIKRLPRKYSNERGRDSSTPIVGTTGSTPLHFASANGNIEVINLLLLHGAHADRPDKHGVTPEMISHQNGWVECSTILRDWIENKDRDLREREGLSVVQSQRTSDVQYSPSPSRRRLHVKRSMDTALAMLKTAEGPWKFGPAPVPLLSPQKSSGEYESPSPPPLTLPMDPNRRRPSLPQILEPPPDTFHESKISNTHPRRPRSAGTGAEQREDAFYSTYGRGGAARKQGNKCPLMNIFKKTSSGDGPEHSLSTSEVPSSQDSPSLGSIPIPSSAVTLPLLIRSSHSSNSSTHSLHHALGLPATAPSRSSFFTKFSEHSSGTGRFTPQMQAVNLPPILSKPSGTHQPPTPLAVELHHALAEQSSKNMDPAGNVPNFESLKATSPIPRVHSALHLERNRTASASRTLPDSHPVREGDSPPAINDNSIDFQERKVNPSPNSRPGILRAHNRSSSSGPGSPLHRTLRFDSNSSLSGGDRRAKESPRGTPALLRPVLNSSFQSKPRVLTKHDSPITGTQDLSADGDKRVVENEGEVEEDENYDHVLSSGALKLDVPSVLLQRQRGLSFGSSSDAELSPIDSVDDSCIAGLKSDFPFSFNDGPMRLLAGEGMDDVSPSMHYLAVPVSPDNRDRGDSLSSNSTTSDYRNNSQTDSSSRGAISTPGLSSILGSPPLSVRSDRTRDVDFSMSTDEELSLPALSFSSSRGTRRSHRPLDIEAHAVSSYEEAEALVQQTRQGVLDLAGKQETSFIGSGHTPLSAMLAAYGESLALERKLREQKESEGKNRFFPVPKTAPAALSSQRSLSRQKSRERVQRQHSLREHGTTRGSKRLRNDPRRPSTAEGGTYSFAFT